MQESHNDDFENSFDLTCFKSKPSRPSGRKRGPSDTFESKGARASSVPGCGGTRSRFTLIFSPRDPLEL